MMPARLRPGAPYALYALIAAWYCAPLFAVPDGLGSHDWDQHLFYYGSVIKSGAEYGQLPFWNPWYCGGNVLWQNPQVPLLSPVFPLVTVMSLPLAMKVNIAIHYWVGLAGMHLLLTRSLRLQAWAVSTFLAIVVALSGAMALHLAVGHSVFLPVLYLPVQMHFVIRAIREGSTRPAVLASMPLALMVYNGALHAVPMSVAAVGGFSLVAAIGLRRVRPLVLGALVIVLGFAFSAPKLLPVALFVTSDRFVDARTTIEHPDAMNGEMLLRTYLDRYQDRGLRFDGQRSGWYEYGNYIGGLAAAFIAGSLLWAFLVRGEPGRWIGVALAVCALVFLVLSAGEFAAWAPASLAHYVPLFSSFRIPSRYTFGFVLCGAATAGWVCSTLMSSTTMRQQTTKLLGAVALIGAADVAVQTRQQLVGVFGGAPLEQGFKWGRGVTTLDVDATSDPYRSGSPMLHALMADRAFYRCYESLQLVRTATPDGPLIAVDDTVKVFDVRFSPNRVDLSLAGGRGLSAVRLNQNAAKGWTSDIGPIDLRTARGPLTATLPEGAAGRFSFWFVPPGLYVGVGILLVALVVATVMWRRDIPAPAADARLPLALT